MNKRTGRKTFLSTRCKGCNRFVSNGPKPKKPKTCTPEFCGIRKQVLFLDVGPFLVQPVISYQMKCIASG